MKNAILLSNWNFVRVIRLCMGLYIFVQSIIDKQFTFAIFGFLFVLMALFNYSCCGNYCNKPIQKKENSDDLKNEIIYEEVD
jgi:accessory gene regulator protein AgrB